MPKDPRSRSLAAALAIVACLACGGKVPPTLYYVLDLPAPALAEERLGRTAVLMPIRTSKLVGQGRLVYRESREQVGYYEYHRWAEDPEDSIADSLLRALMARGTFASVAPFDGRTRSDFLVRGELRRLEEIDYDGPVRRRRFPWSLWTPRQARSSGLEPLRESRTYLRVRCAPWFRR